MKIPRDLLPEILARHQKGQSDSAIARWLATLDPPITVVRLTVRQARMLAAKGAAAERKPAKVVPLFPGKASGSQNRKRQKAEKEREQADHRDRGAVIIEAPDSIDPMEAHVSQLIACRQLQALVNADKLMTLPEKIRATTVLGQTIAKLRVDAEIESEIKEIRVARKREAADMKALRTELEREKRRLAALRRELEQQGRAG